MEIYKLPKPDSTIDYDEVFKKFPSPGPIMPFIEKANTPIYLFWDKVRYKPRPKELSAEEFWAVIKLLRQYSSSRTNTVVKDKQGKPFSWQPLPGMDYFLHDVDMNLGGLLQSQAPDDQPTRRTYISGGVIEEAIASSQLEGANTTRRVAKRMIVEKRAPSNKPEQMIMNNYQTMLDVEGGLCNKEMSLDLLCDLHELLTHDTIKSDEVGRFRKAGENIVVHNTKTGDIHHVPPPLKFMKKEIKRFIAYANDAVPKAEFVHPLIKAIILHFWIAYLHPFTDGNGRLARTIFYWYLLRKEYWAFSYLHLSRVILKSPTQYSYAYLYTEQDDNDLTYFIDYNIRKIRQAKNEFEKYYKRKEAENRSMAKLARGKYKLNDRQIQLLKYLHKDATLTSSIKSHSHMNDIGRMTARKDLERLEELGFLTSEKVGRDRPFTATSKTSELFQ